MKNQKPAPLSRRAFLKMSGATSLGLALSSCGFTPTATSTLTNTPIPANSPTPTDTPTPIPSTTPTPTEASTNLSVEESPWASEKGQVDPWRMLYTIGSVDTVHKHALDLSMGSMHLACLQKDDLTTVSDHETRRKTLADQLDASDSFLSQVDAVQNSFVKPDEFKEEIDFSKLTLIVDVTGVVTMALVRVGNMRYRRYAVDREGKLTFLDEGLPPRPAKIRFEDDFEHGHKMATNPNADSYDGWGRIPLEFGVAVARKPVREILNDHPEAWVYPDGTPRGTAVVATVKYPPINTGWSGNDLWFAGYYGWTNGDMQSNFPILPAPTFIETAIWATPNMGAVSVLSGHRFRAGNRLDNTSSTGIELYRGGRVGYTVRQSNGSQDGPYLDAGLYEPGEWNTLRLVVERDGRVLPFINGQLAISDPLKASSFEIDKNNPSGISDAHAGINRSVSPSDFKNKNPDAQIPKEGAIVVNDDFVVGQFLED